MVDQRPRPRESRSLRNMVLMNHLQWKYIVVVVGACLAVGTILSLLIRRYELQIKDFLIAEASDYGDSLAEAFANQFGNTWTSVLPMAAVGAVVMVFGLVIMTHRVAGPLAKAERYFQKVARGELPEVPKLRRWDLMRRFFAHLRVSRSAVADRFAEQREAALELKSKVGKLQLSEAQNQSLAKMIETLD